MTGLQSMTGFATAARKAGSHEIICDIRSVNNKGLDIRLRLPSGLEALEPEIKKLVPGYVARGSIQVFLSVSVAGGTTAQVIDGDLFRAVASEAGQLAQETGMAPPTADGILAVRGVVMSSDGDGRFDPESFRAPCLDAITEALQALAAARSAEGEALSAVLSGHLASIADLVRRASEDPASQAFAIRNRLHAQIESLLADANAFDETRLHTEAAMLATKADIREEIDRLRAHADSAQKMLSSGGVIGRKLDFLSQEFNREANTICSKSAASSLTAIGLEMKSVIDQFREQVQNIQ
jgi:uncharacterized protein (TIGR00255 family)